MKIFRLAFAFLLLTGCVRTTYLLTEDEVPIAYEHHVVKDAKGSVVLLHGLGMDIDEWFYLSKDLQKDGWSTLAIDFRGHGLSRDWKGEELNWKEFTDKGFWSTLRDVKAAREHLGEAENIWIIGSSFGANMAVNFASADPSVEGIVLLSPGVIYAGVDILPAVKKYGDRPVLCVGSYDNIGVVESCTALLEEVKGPQKLLAYKEAGHGSKMLENEKKLTSEILLWMNQHTV